MSKQLNLLDVDTAEATPSSTVNRFIEQAAKEQRALNRTESLLRISLGAAVPLLVQRFIDCKMTLAQVFRQAHDCGGILSEKGDVLMYGGKGCATAFNALALGVAAGSFAPGGITVFGLHFESDPKCLAD
jgi:hypothetical protein